MKNGMALAIVFFAVMAAVALRTAARQPEPRWASGPAPEPDRPSRPADAVEQTQTIFHELHADGRNAACAVCDSQYRSA